MISLRVESAAGSNQKFLACSGLKTDRKTGAQTGAQFAIWIRILRILKKCFGIIRAALSLLKAVDDFPHNPKVAGSNPAPATNQINNLTGPLGILRAQ